MASTIPWYAFSPLSVLASHARVDGAHDSAAVRKEGKNSPDGHLWVTQDDINQNLRDFEDQFAAITPSEGDARAAAAQVLDITRNYARYQKHQLLHICLWALRRRPKLVRLRATEVLRLVGARAYVS